MAIKIMRAGDKYVAEITPPHARGTFWSTAEPITVDELIHELLSRGCHQTDIGDALYEADDAWMLRLKRDD